MDIDQVTLYYQDASGNVRMWAISASNFEVCMEFGTPSGEIQEQFEYIREGLGGRTREEQLRSRFNSRLQKKLDKGYVYSIEDAMSSKPKNQLGLSKPMLAQRIDKVKNVDFTKAMVQYKYNGHRCLVTSIDGKKIAYSRNGKLIDSIDHILEHIAIDDGQILDGELYIHGWPLQTISSLIKRKQAGSKELRYMVYDTIEDLSYQSRLEIIRGIHLGEYSQVVPTWNYREEALHGEMKIALNTGYEGLMIRLDNYPYEESKRSKGLIKVKKFIDEEFTVIRVSESSDGWAILHCTTKNGKEFKMSAPGNMAEKTYVLKNKKDFIGRQVNGKFAEYTKDGVPFHPIATSWRNKAEE